MAIVDATSAYYQKVASAISDAIKEKGYTQLALAKECGRRYGIPVSQSTISKIVCSESGHNISMVYISVICQVLGLDLTAVLSVDDPKMQENTAVPAGLIFRDAKDNAGVITLIADPTHDAFLGYVDKEYDIFFLPTASGENEMLSGTMTLSNEEDKYCKVHIVINNNKQPPKEYFGQMLISDRMRACYCIVKSDRLGEICSFVFNHKYFTQASLTIRLATVTTVSAGGAQRPTMHRMIICKRGLVSDEEKKAFIAAQLRLNGSSIMISERKFNELCEDNLLHDLLQALKARNPSTEPYYIIEEGDVTKLRRGDRMARINLLAKLRDNSMSKRYNKIGESADDILYEYFT